MEDIIPYFVGGVAAIAAIGTYFAGYQRAVSAGFLQGIESERTKRRFYDVMNGNDNIDSLDTLIEHNHAFFREGALINTKVISRKPYIIHPNELERPSYVLDAFSRIEQEGKRIGADAISIEQELITQGEQYIITFHRYAKRKTHLRRIK